MTVYANNDLGIGVYPEGFRGNNMGSALITNNLNISFLFKSTDQKNAIGVNLQASPLYAFDGFGFEGTELQRALHFYAQANFKIVINENFAFTFSLPLTSPDFETNSGLNLDSSRPLLGIQFNPNISSK